jgi:hypothetical protein
VLRCLQPGASSQQQQQQQPGVEQVPQQHAEHKQQQQQQHVDGEQQQQQQSQEGVNTDGNSSWYMSHLHVPGDHQLLLAWYACESADLAALEQQHLAGMHHIR